MKTAIKIAALAVLVLAVLSCTDISVSDRDWDAIDEGKTTENPYGFQSIAQTIVRENFEYLPSLNWNCGSPYSEGTLKIYFPSSADILTVDNAGIIAELKKFMSFFTFAVNADPLKPSTRGSEVDNLTFVDKLGDAITIKINNIPTGAVLMAVKIDGTKYTFDEGIKFDLNGDGKAGEAVYDDAYAVLRVDATAPYDEYVPAGGKLQWWQTNNIGELIQTLPLTISNTSGSTAYNRWGLYQNLTLTLGGTYNIIVMPIEFVSPFEFGAFTPLSAPHEMVVANIDGNGKLGTDTTAAVNEILGLIKSKLKLQKYKGGGEWENMNNELTVSTTDIRILLSPPDDMAVCRLRIEGITGLTTGEYLGAKQFVEIFYESDELCYLGEGNFISFKHEGFYTDKPDKLYFTSGETGAGDVFKSPTNQFINYDRDGRNVTIEMEVPVITTSKGTDLQLKNISSLDDFNKGFKLAYRTGVNKTIAGTALRGITDLAFLDVDEVKVEKKKYPTEVEKTYLVLTLDPKYQYRAGDEFTVLLSPRFNGFGESKVIFGNPANIDIIIEVDGEDIDCWDVYGIITL